MQRCLEPRSSPSRKYSWINKFTYAVETKGRNESSHHCWPPTEFWLVWGVWTRTCSIREMFHFRSSY